MSRFFTILIAIATSVTSAGCASITAELAARPMRDVLGLSRTNNYSSTKTSLLGIDEQMRVPVDDYGRSVHIAVFSPDKACNGTILLLHGSVTGPVPAFGQAKKFSRAGYCCAVMTFRGFGRSSRGYRTFGQSERFDVMKVIDSLQERGLADRGVGIWGISYGASVTIDAAAIDPRIRAVVAVAPFSEMRTGLPDGLRGEMPLPALLFDDETHNDIVNRTAEIAGFCPENANQLAVVSQVSAPILYIHGTADRTVRIEHSERLFKETTSNAELFRLPLTGHVGAFLDVNGQATRKAVQWFDTWL